MALTPLLSIFFRPLLLEHLCSLAASSFFCADLYGSGVQAAESGKAGERGQGSVEKLEWRKGEKACLSGSLRSFVSEAKGR